MSTITELLKAKSYEELSAMTDDELRIYFADAIAAEPKPLPKPLVKTLDIIEPQELDSLECPIKQPKKKKPKNSFDIDKLEKELENE